MHAQVIDTAEAILNNPVHTAATLTTACCSLEFLSIILVADHSSFAASAEVISLLFHTKQHSA